MHFPLGKGAGIAIEDSVLPADLCQKIVKYLNKRPHLHTAGKTHGGRMPDVKNCTDVILAGANPYVVSKKESNRLSKFESQIFGFYSVHLTKYFDSYSSLDGWTERQDTGYQYQKYNKGEGFYKSHIDGAPYLKTDARTRVLASVMYLNTVEIGGGTHFEYHEFTCDAVEGRVVTFPSTFVTLHGGLVPESDDKHIISTFVFCPS